MERRPSIDFRTLFERTEHVLYVLIGLALAAAAFLLLGQVLYHFGKEVTSSDLGWSDALLEGLDGLLLVFIFAELLHTVRVVVAEDRLKVEPFLVVGIVAAIRHFVVGSAEIQQSVGKDSFMDQIAELGLVVAAVPLIGVTIWLLRQERPNLEDAETPED